MRPYTLRKLFLCGIFCLAVIAGLDAQTVQNEPSIDLKEGWKFTIGDNLEYAQPGYNDAQWQKIAVDKIWEEQGHDPYDGFAWYRLKVVIPAELKKQAFIKDGLRLFLGKINNFDQSFLNGAIIGINGENVPADTKIDTSFTHAETRLWNQERTYVLPIDDPRIKWDQENIIAVRVYDEGGQGGIWNGDLAIRMINLADYITLDYKEKSFEFKDNGFIKNINLKNISSSHTIRGKFSIIAENKLDNKREFFNEAKLELTPGAAREFTIKLDKQDQSSLVTYRFEFLDTAGRFIFTEESPYILTPKAAQTPRINGAAIYGASPNRPFLYTVAVSGERPMVYSATGLPRGLAIDKNTGIISGRAAEKGEYSTILHVKNNYGEDTRPLKIIIGDKIALTPPLGWNSWNCWGLSIDENKALEAAQAFVEKGLIQYGWTYINIDDGWEIVGNSPQPKRDVQGNISTNEKFKDMKALGDKIHALGLKFGIYSSPGPLTCGGYTASYQHEQQDAQSFASWGIDYLKYDWCSYDKIAADKSPGELKKPYFVMRSALDRVDRDIVYSLCQYGMGNVWEWGKEVGGNLWRTTGDITDTWDSMSGIGFTQIENAPFAGPGHWNDPDMLVVGWVGWGPALHPTALTPDEQYTHITQWCLLSAPLLIGCDLKRLDDFTLNLLTNAEVLAVDQDPLGKQASPIIKKDNIQVWLKELHNGDKALGIFNLGTAPQHFTLQLLETGFAQGALIRDLWRQKDLGRFEETFTAHVPAHGVLFLELSR